MLQALLADEPSVPRRVAREIWGGLPTAPIVVALVDPVGRIADSVAAYLDLRAGEHHDRVFFGRGEDGLVVCVSAEHSALLDELSTSFDLHVGVSTPTGYERFSRAYREAKSARGAGETHVTRFDDVARLGVFALAEGGAATAAARALLEPLVQHDSLAGTALVHTVQVWLEHDAKGDAAARALGIHRHTVRTRISHAERLLDADLSTFAGRAELWAALRLIELSS